MQLKRLVPVLLSAMALMASCASSASATAIEVGGAEIKEEKTYTLSLEVGFSFTMSRTDGSLANTCTKVHLGGHIPWYNHPALWLLNITEFSFGGPCIRPVVVHKPGSLSVQYTSGTNGTVSSSEAEVTVGTAFGTVNCKTGSGTDLGTLTGVSSGQATVHVNAVVNCGFLLPSANWKGTLKFSSPSGLGVTS